MGIIRKIIVRITPALWPVDIINLRIGNRTIAQDSKDTGNVVLVRLDAIGDFVIWLDSAAHIRQCMRNSHLILICNKACTDIAQASGYFDEIISLDSGKLNYAGNFAYRHRLRRELAGIRADKVIQTTFTRRVYTDTVVSAIASKEKITMRDTSYDNAAAWAIHMTDKIYTTIYDTSDVPMMELRRNAGFAQQVTGISKQAAVPVLKESAVRPGIIPKAEYFVVFPGGSFNAKLWPIERFAAVAQHINGKTGWLCCICGGPADRKLADGLKRNYNGEILDMTGKTSLIESIEIIRHAHMLIGNDTSGIHFAAAVDTPSLCVFGGWHYGRFLPYSVDDAQGRCLPVTCVSSKTCFNCRIIHKTTECKKHIADTGLFSCVDEVTVDAVIKEVDSMLQVCGMED